MTITHIAAWDTALIAGVSKYGSMTPQRLIVARTMTPDHTPRTVRMREVARNRDDVKQSKSFAH